MSNELDQQPELKVLEPQSDAKLDVIKILNLSELESECNKPMVCEVSMSGKKFAIECKRLSPVQYSEVERIESSAVPPLIIIGDPKEGKKEYDYKDHKFLEKCRDNAMAALCYAVYHGCPMFYIAKPGLVNANDIKEFVSGKLTIQIIKQLYSTIIQADTALEAVVNFS